MKAFLGAVIGVMIFLVPFLSYKWTAAEDELRTYQANLKESNDAIQRYFKETGDLKLANIRLTQATLTSWEATVEQPGSADNYYYALTKNKGHLQLRFKDKTKLEVGQSIRFIGRCWGMFPSGTIAIADCELEK